MIVDQDNKSKSVCTRCNLVPENDGPCMRQYCPNMMKPRRFDNKSQWCYPVSKDD